MGQGELTNHEPDAYHVAVRESVFRGHDDTWAYFPDPTNPKKLQRVGMRTMLEEVVGKERPFEYEVMYRMGSDAIHTSPFGIGSLLPRVSSSRTFLLEVVQARDSCLVAL